MEDAEKKQAQAMVNALTQQRNRAMDECVQLAAMVSMAQERIAELEKANADTTVAATGA